MFDEDADYIGIINRYVGGWTNKFDYYTKHVYSNEGEKKYVYVMIDI